MGSQPARVMPGMGKRNRKNRERERKEQGRCRRWDSYDKEGERVRWQSCTKQCRKFSADTVTCPS